ncbi:hypothetical protein [Pseudoroseomonas ludipueritiae]|uniref:Uncharacterized protein n=1 Tax=Pseudoroseomonas ludipueritiae TaxID=198093 RepID=A0ABR7REE8_9PROT|nr:hypothetical protein [Pseudoroseomonas ludipueritiae]MBC9180217.1 hypothetical protein [Pseudoroseomonas ludipueritiae]
MPEVNIYKPVKVQAKTLKIHIKVRDMFTASVEDQHGDELAQYEGYVPRFMPGEHFGDYLILDINMDTGTITNWEVPSSDEIEKFLKKAQEE